MQSERAVVSMTLSPRSITSRWVSSGMNCASESTRGSPSYTPWTAFFAMRIASAPISSARNAAAVSVVKNGLPGPDDDRQLRARIVDMEHLLGDLRDLVRVGAVLALAEQGFTRQLQEDAVKCRTELGRSLLSRFLGMDGHTRSGRRQSRRLRSP